MGYAKQYIEKGIRMIFSVFAVFFAVNLIPVWGGKFGLLCSFWAKISSMEGMVGSLANLIENVQAANSRYLLIEGIIVGVSLFGIKQISAVWNYLWKVFGKIKTPFFEYKPVTEVRYTFLEKLCIDINTDNNYKSDVYYVSDKYESEDIRKDGKTNGKKFADDFEISIHDSQVEVKGNNNAEPVEIENKYKHFESGNKITYFRKMSSTFPEPKASNRKFDLRTQKAFCKKYDNTWTTVEIEDQLWEGDIGNGKKAYFRLIDEFGIWKAEHYSKDPKESKDPKVSVEQTKVTLMNKKNHYPMKLELTVKVPSTSGEETRTVLLHYAARYYKPDYDNGRHLSQIESDSDRYPYIIAGCFGPVETGKSSWIAALTSNTSKNRMKQLIGVCYSGEQIEAVAVRTMINKQRAVALAIHDGRTRVGTVYLLDLAGEITKKEKENVAEHEQIIESIGKIADAIIEFSDDRVFYGENYAGDNGNIYEALHNAKKKGIGDYIFMMVCCKGDILKGRSKKQPKFTTHAESGRAIPIVTPDSVVFKSVAEIAEKSIMGADELIYQHMTLAREILKDAKITVEYDRDKCFIVSAGTDTTFPDGRTGVDCDNEVNCELPLAYLIQTKFGISLNADRRNK